MKSEIPNSYNKSIIWHSIISVAGLHLDCATILMHDLLLDSFAQSGYD